MSDRSRVNMLANGFMHRHPPHDLAVLFAALDHVGRLDEVLEELQRRRQRKPKEGAKP